MLTKEFQEISGLPYCPVYWDKRYVKNLDKLSKPKYTVAIDRDVVIELRDGCKILTDVYRPAEGGKFPALIAWSAYGKEMQALRRGPVGYDCVVFDHSLEAGDMDFYVQRGYVFLIPDPRGIGKSEGEFLGVYNPQEQKDLYDTLEWAAVQDWCDGNVTFHGYSYFGIIQALVAAMQPPHLRCIMPLSFTDDYYQHGYYGGAANTYMNMYWELCPANNPVPWTTKMMSEEEMKARMKEVQKDPDIACISYFLKILNVWPPKYHTFYLDYLLHPQRDEYWNQRSAMFIYDKIKVPAYIKCGWAPLGRWSAPVFNAYTNPDFKVYKRIGVGMETDGGMNLPYRYMDPECLRWYDHWLKGIDTGITEEPDMKIKIIGRGFRYEHEWPLARTVWRKLYLHPFEKLKFEPNAEGNIPPDTFSHRPPNITTFVEKIRYQSQPLGRPVEFTGPCEAHLFIAIDAPDANLIVKFGQMFGGSKGMYRGGVLKMSYPLDKEKSRIGRPEHDYTKRVPITPGEIREYVVEINPIAMVFNPGSSMYLEIQGFDPNPYQKYAWEGKSASIQYIPPARTVNYKIYRDKDYESYILLPYIPYTPGDSWLQPLCDDDIR